jgi:Tol biopolymer transport system component/predicted Ser/Thr protein kinase
MLTSGTKLGAYEVVAQIGAGGMGEVYSARDTRLNRDVAIKVLPAHLANKPELRERFEREARTIASLNHPHICTLYDIGHQDGTDFLVMEHLEGETLAQRLLKGPLPLDQVLQYAIEIADALDKAHRKGVTHRDLKPGNIMLTKAGAKLLDFGLAKLKQEASPAAALSALPTITAKDAITAEGTILGTLQYMAPEQVEGKEADARTDIFAFGAVVYEMATGKRAFEGKTSASVMAKILETDPAPMSSLQPMTPPALDRVVRKCMAKEPDQRWQTASDLCGELKWVAEGSTQSAKPVSTIADRRGLLQRWVLISGLACLIVAAIAGFVGWNLKPAPPRPVTRTVINLPPGDQLAGLDYPAIALSPNGAQLAYVATRDGIQQIYLRAMDSLESRSVPGTEGAVSPFFSPDGQWLGFFADRKLKKVSVSGGAALTLSDVGTPRGASWGSHGMIVFSDGSSTVLRQISDGGGAAHPVTSREVVQRWPEFLPGGNAVLFAEGFITNSSVAVQFIATRERQGLVPGGTFPRYAPSGHLVYSQGGNLMAVPFDPRRMKITGAAVPVVEGVESRVSGATQYSISATGLLAYIPGGVQGAQRRLVWVSRNGAEQPLAAPVRAYESPRLSPDGRRLAVSAEGQIWLYDFSREILTRFTFEGTSNNRPVWTPDGKRIAFYSNKEGLLNIFWQKADGSGGLERLTSSENTQVPHSWSPDGQLLAIQNIDPSDVGLDIWIMRLSDRKAQPFLRTPFRKLTPRFSPDGHWLAYQSDQSGRDEIYVLPYPGPGGQRQVSTEGGTEPVWNPSGRELFYRNGDKMMAVAINTQPSFSVGKPQVLFERPYASVLVQVPNYDVSPDGQRFLMIKESEQVRHPATQINVVLNWTEELKHIVSAGTK